MLQQRLLLFIVALLLGITSVWAADETLTTPKESLQGLRPGTLTVAQLRDKFGKPAYDQTGNLLGLYGGAKDSQAYGWFMVENPDYTVPDLAVETAKDSDRVDLLMIIGYDGMKTEKGITCFDSADDVIKAYGAPAYAFAAPMNGFLLRELYYPELGLSFDLAPVNAQGDLQVIAVYVTYPEYLKKAIDIRKDLIEKGTGQDVTDQFSGATAA